MADYRLTAFYDDVIRTADDAYIPNDPLNRDWVEYQDWLAEGGVPDPYVPLTPPAPPPEDVVLYDHENRLRALEGEPPLSLDDFTAMKTQRK
jgi:hypothetical protein